MTASNQFGEKFWEFRERLSLGWSAGINVTTPSEEIDRTVKKLVAERTAPLPDLLTSKDDPWWEPIVPSRCPPAWEMRLFWMPVAVAFAESESAAQDRRIRLLRERPDIFVKPFASLVDSLRSLRDCGGLEVLRLWQTVPNERYLRQPKDAENIVEAIIGEFDHTIVPMADGKIKAVMDTHSGVVELLALLHQEVKKSTNVSLHRGMDFWARSYLWVASLAFARFKGDDCRRHRSEFTGFLNDMANIIPSGKCTIGAALIESFFRTEEGPAFKIFYQGIYQELDAVLALAPGRSDGEKRELQRLLFHHCYLGGTTTLEEMIEIEKEFDEPCELCGHRPLKLIS